MQGHGGSPIASTLKTLLLVGSLLVQPDHFDVLPMYVVLMLAVPLLVRAWKAGRLGWVVGLCGGLWFLSQPGVLELPVLPAWVDLGYFNFFAWQFLFVCGFALGCLQRNRKMGDGFDSPLTCGTVLVLFSLLLVLRHSRLVLGPAPVDVSLDLASWWFAKPTLGPLRIIDFGMFAYLLAQVAKRVGPWLEKTLVHRYLRFLGQHSLPVFAWSMLLWSGIHYAFRMLGVAGSSGAETALGLVAVASLTIPAWLHALYRQRPASRRAELGQMVYGEPVLECERVEELR